jgi:serine/threonine protein kinase
VLRHLGFGGMGVVVEAEYVLEGTRVALKLMNPGLANCPGALERFAREARGQAMVEHPHVVPITDFDVCGGTPFIVMPLLQGEPLSARLKRERTLPLGDLLRIGRQTAEGLQAAHEKGIIHRDVKPGNVWLQAPVGTARVMDFGLCLRKEDDRLTQCGWVGTAAYMAPERLERERGGVASDLWSLGVVLYEAATGTRSFLEDWRFLPARERRPELPAGLDGLILKLLAARPEKRPATAREVADELRALEGTAK